MTILAYNVISQHYSKFPVGRQAQFHCCEGKTNFVLKMIDSNICNTVINEKRERFLIL